MTKRIADKLKELIKEYIRETFKELDEIQAPMQRSLSRRDLKRLSLKYHDDNPDAYSNFLNRGDKDGTYQNVMQDIQKQVKNNYGVDIDINDTEELIVSSDPDYSIN